MEIFTASGKTAKFLETIGNLYKCFSVLEKKDDYELQLLESSCVLVDESFKTLKLFETNARNHLHKPCTNLDGPHGFMSSKSLLSFEMTKWSLGRLRNLFTEFSYDINRLRMMTLSVEHFHATSHVKTPLMGQLQYSRSFITTVKVSSKRNSHWSTYCFTSEKGNWYPPLENSLPFSDLRFPKKFINSPINKEDEELLIEWAADYIPSERQRTVRQETTMSKMGTLPFYLYKKDIRKEAFKRGIYTDPQSSNSPSENKIDNYSDNCV